MNQTRSPVLVDLRLRVERKPARPTSNPFLLRGARGTEGSPSSAGAEGFVDGGDGSVTSSRSSGGGICDDRGMSEPRLWPPGAAATAASQASGCDGRRGTRMFSKLGRRSDVAGGAAVGGGGVSLPNEASLFSENRFRGAAAGTG